MSLIFSKAWGYAVRALLYLHQHRDEGYILGSVIAEKESIPNPFLTKVLGRLTAAGITKSTRGRHGGFILNRKLDSITLKEVLNLFEPAADYNRCILGEGVCPGDDSCPVHPRWAEINAAINDFLDHTTIANLEKEPLCD